MDAAASDLRIPVCPCRAAGSHRSGVCLWTTIGHHGVAGLLSRPLPAIPAISGRIASRSETVCSPDEAGGSRPSGKPDQVQADQHRKCGQYAPHPLAPLHIGHFVSGVFKRSMDHVAGRAGGRDWSSRPGRDMARGTTPDRLSGTDLPGVRPRNKRGIPTLTPAVPGDVGGSRPAVAGGGRPRGRSRRLPRNRRDGPVPFRC